MKDLSKIRNIGIIAHVDSGKTSLTEAILYDVGKKHYRGKVDNGNTVTDDNPIEKERGVTIFSSCVTFNWGYKEPVQLAI
jgi:elongation factor G